jgi:hypothetical protein
VGHVHQHLQRVELWVIDEVCHRADAAARDRFGTEKNLPLRRGLLLEAML